MQAVGRLATLGASLVLFAHGAEAQSASLVRDISTARPDQSSSFVGRMVSIRSAVFFVRADFTVGDEAWASDGTSAGTELLVDGCPGACSSRPLFLATTSNLVFWVTAGDAQPRLWRSDGTRAGTFALAGAASDLTVSLSSLPEPPTVALIDETLYFPGCTPDLGCDLWRSDGTPEGTVLVFDAPGVTGIHAAARKLFFVGQTEPGELALWSSNGTAAGTIPILDLDARPLALVGTTNRLFFIRVTGSARQLWVSDGTAAGTRQLTSFPAQGVAVRQGSTLQAIGSRVYFLADDGVGGEEIWRSDGTAAGTVRITEFQNPRPFLAPLELVEVADRLIFKANAGDGYGLWSTTGVSRTMSRLAGSCPGCPRLLLEHPLVQTAGRALFAAETTDHGRELWRTDGTQAGTGLLADVCSGRCGGLLTGPARAGSTAFFVASEEGVSSRGANLWRSDGTAAGTHRFTHFTGELEVSQSFLVARGPEVFFTARTQYGHELWVGDGTRPGTRLLTDFADRHDSSTPLELVALGERLFFTACEDRFRKLWRTAGSAATTLALAPSEPETDCPGPNRFPQELTAAAGRLFFLREETLHEPQVWTSDGTPEGTARLAGLPPDLLTTSGSGFAEIHGEVFFTGADPFEYALWQTNGATGGTRKAVDFPTESAADIRHLTALGNELYFTAADHEFGRDVWRSDGTPEGTRKVTDFFGRFNHAADPEFTRVGPWVYFIGREQGGFAQVWKTDGTLAGSTPVHAAGTSLSPAGVGELVSLSGNLYFFAATSSGRGLWRTDGSPEGTVLVRGFRHVPDPGQNPGFLTVFADSLFFVADDGLHGRELWRSDGTDAGTVLVRDIMPGPPGSHPRGLRPAGGRLFFAAGDGVHGWELWQTDGTAQGTRMVQDIAPGAASSYPEELTAAANRLYFSADDGLSGRELWLLELGAPESACVTSPAALCLGGRFRVTATWRDFTGNTGAGTALPLTADTGAFWFFGPENLEVILKVLDGRGLNQHHWVFYGALSSVEYALTVTDVQTGLTARYWNPTGQLASVADTTGFGPLGAFSVAEPSSASGPPPRAGSEVAAVTGPCQPAATRLCLRGGRFAVEATWKDFSGNTGVGSAVPLTGDTGYFWFFGADNVEVVLKVLDGTAVNGKHWVFYGALSSVEYTLRVTDTATGAVKTYTNKSGNLASVADTGAF